MKEFKSFKDFYPLYLKEHSNRTCRLLHFIGTTLVLALVIRAFVIRDAMLLCWLPLVGYGFAWAGHFFFEKNRPATFQNPIYSLIGDFAMYADILRGKIKL